MPGTVPDGKIGYGFYPHCSKHREYKREFILDLISGTTNARSLVNFRQPFFYLLIAGPYQCSILRWSRDSYHLTHCGYHNVRIRIFQFIPEHSIHDARIFIKETSADHGLGAMPRAVDGSKPGFGNFAYNRLHHMIAHHHSP